MRSVGMLIVLTAALTGSPDGDMSPQAKAYLDRAITLFREQHINASKMDWPTLTAKAYATASGARTTADSYPAIQLIIKELGEKHTQFRDPDQAKADSTGQTSGQAFVPPLLLPEAMRLSNDIGVIRLYGFMGSVEQSQLYAQTGQLQIDGMRSLGVCKFVLDLRSDNGGNMYPMIDAVSGLLDDGVLGTFESADGTTSSWLLKDGKTISVTSAHTPPPAIGTGGNSMPVAVLIGPSTLSAGEYTAMSFKGRPNTRFFGAPTGGYITANQPVLLSDGAVIVMTGAWGSDRTGRKYVDDMQPDEVTGGGGPTMDAAVAWLAGQRCESSRPKRISRTSALPKG